MKQSIKVYEIYKFRDVILNINKMIGLRFLLIRMIYKRVGVMGSELVIFCDKIVNIGIMSVRTTSKLVLFQYAKGIRKIHGFIRVFFNFVV